MRLSLIQGLVRISTQCRLFDDQQQHIWRTAQLGEVSKGASCLPTGVRGKKGQNLKTNQWCAQRFEDWRWLSESLDVLRWSFVRPGLASACFSSLNRMPSEQDELLWTSFQRRMNWWEPLFKAGSTDAHSTESSALLNVQPSSSVFLGKT